MSSLHLEVLTPEKRAIDTQTESVYLQGSEGRLGIMPQHTALIARLDFGSLEYQSAGKTKTVLAGSGIVEVHNDRVTVLVKSAESKDEIDVERAKQALSRAKSRRDSKDRDVDMLRAEAALYRAVQRLKFTGAM